DEPFFNQTGGPCGGPTGSLACAPDGVLYLIADGIYRSENGGEHWVKLATSPTNASGLAVSPSGAVYAFRYDRTWRSADGGQTWPGVPQAAGQMTVLYFDPAGHAFAGTWSGLYRSADSGTTSTLVGMSG